MHTNKEKYLTYFRLLYEKSNSQEQHIEIKYA